MKTVGELMAIEREKRGLTLKEYAQKSGLNYVTVWNIENYGSSVSLGTLDKICSSLQLDRKMMAEANLKCTKIYKDYTRYIQALDKQSNSE